MFGWFRKRPTEERQVKVFLNPLHVLLAARETQKGSPLTQEEVLETRDTAASVMMPASRAEAFYASLDAQVPIGRLDPDRVWEQWQEVRGQLAEPPAAVDANARE